MHNNNNNHTILIKPVLQHNNKNNGYTVRVGLKYRCCGRYIAYHAYKVISFARLQRHKKCTYNTYILTYKHTHI